MPIFTDQIETDRNGQRCLMLTTDHVVPSWRTSGYGKQQLLVRELEGYDFTVSILEKIERNVRKPESRQQVFFGTKDQAQALFDYLWDKGFRHTKVKP